MTGSDALVHKDRGTSYGVSCPDLPGCISAGDTMDEALANAAEALAGHLALMRRTAASASRAAECNPAATPRARSDAIG